jgi:hypothetical protein
VCSLLRARFAATGGPYAVAPSSYPPDGGESSITDPSRHGPIALLAIEQPGLDGSWWMARQGTFADMRSAVVRDQRLGVVDVNSHDGTWLP